MKTKETELLRLNLQFFSEEPPADPPATATISMTQAEFDRAIGERLAREKAKTEKAVEEARAEAERKRLEDEAKFKELYEAEKAAREQVEAKARAAEMLAKKQALLLEAGYSADKLADIFGFITGDDEESVKASVERFKAVAPPTPAYVDPTTGGGGRQQPGQKDDSYEKARERARKLLKR